MFEAAQHVGFMYFGVIMYICLLKNLWSCLQKLLRTLAAGKQLTFINVCTCSMTGGVYPWDSNRLSWWSVRGMAHACSTRWVSNLRHHILKAQQKSNEPEYIIRMEETDIECSVIYVSRGCCSQRRT